MECHKGLDATLGPVQHQILAQNWGSRAGISRLGISHLLFSTLNVQICLFWVSMLNFGGVFFNKQCDGIPGKHVVFVVVDFCINFKLSQKERLPVAIVYVRNSVAWYLIFFFGGGLCFFRYNFICLP